MPVLAFPGTFSDAAIATFTGPAPVDGLASKILTAAGAKAAAGTVSG